MDADGDTSEEQAASLAFLWAVNSSSSLALSIQGLAASRQEEPRGELPPDLHAAMLILSLSFPFLSLCCHSLVLRPLTGGVQASRDSSSIQDSSASLFPSRSSESIALCSICSCSLALTFNSRSLLTCQAFSHARCLSISRTRSLSLASCLSRADSLALSRTRRCTGDRRDFTSPGDIDMFAAFAPTAVAGSVTAM